MTERLTGELEVLPLPLASNVRSATGSALAVTTGGAGGSVLAAGSGAVRGTGVAEGVGCAEGAGGAYSEGAGSSGWRGSRGTHGGRPARLMSLMSIVVEGESLFISRSLVKAVTGSVSSSRRGSLPVLGASTRAR